MWITNGGFADILITFSLYIDQAAIWYIIIMRNSISHYRLILVFLCLYVTNLFSRFLIDPYDDIHQILCSTSVNLGPGPKGICKGSGDYFSPYAYIW